ncbi:type VI secretion system-associated FHA domain protein TagH [Sphingomonas jatrophae]|uniref:Type VI secretion system FHA domain protein n=1 Tax=Sphingomonas jatrophae TaxID=1166337 RepID=A0A1I6LKC0_9SPHN|nr:type VI secretion system-associated FHA domain protein TagH [Sphingomonas jatrophae]SFS03821.1 type VI secretion system FHA domain protein [Sphingomonas jatrophae]
MWGGHGSGAPKLGLTIRNVDALDNGVPTRIDLDQRGAVIGRSATVDWSLPDPRAYISSRHAEIDFVDGQYRLIDVSTNGTFINGATERSYEPVTLKDGDVIAVGHYEIVVTLTGGPAAAAPPPAAPPAASGGWGGWDSGAAAAPAAGSGWGSAASVAAPALGAGAASAAWAAPAIPKPDASAWGAPPGDAAGGWGAAATPAAPSADGWGAPASPAAPASDGWGTPASPATPAAPATDGWGAPAPSGNDGWGAAPAAPAADAGGWGAAPAAPAAGGNDGWGAAAAPAPSSNDGWGAAPAAESGASAGWGSPPPATGPAPSNASWAAPAPAPASPSPTSSFAAPTEAFVPTHKTVEQAPNPSAWDRPAEQGQAASGWSSAVADRPSAPTADDVWGKINDGNVVDWARGGFGAAAAPAETDKLGLTPRNAIAALPATPPPAAGFGGSPPPAARPAPAPAPTAFPTPPAAAAYTPPAPMPMPPQAPAAPAAAPQPPAAAPGSGEAMARFLAEAGLKRGDLKGNDADLMASAGGLVRRLVAGLVVMLEARARAKSQMGAQSTALEFDGNNPMKFARTPEGALAQLLNPVERGFMPADRAVEDAFHDLQSHQIATLKAMQGALKATLDRFSPTAIKARAEDKGLMSRILPGARDAALWQAYEREFGGVAHGSDEAFMEVFSREFKRAYEEQSARRPKK